MMYRGGRFVPVLLFSSFFLPGIVCAQTPPAADQQINEFSLAGYGDRGEKAWDLSGKTADIFDETVRLDDVIGNLYGEDTDIKLKADRGNFHRVDGSVRLENNVTITTSTGAQLSTDSLDWNRKEQVVSTEDQVNIKRDNIEVSASGATGTPNLKQVSLEKDVRLDILPSADEQGMKVKSKTTITCEGPLEIDYEKNVATFKKNVEVRRPDATIYSDTLDIYFAAQDQGEPDAGSDAVGVMGGGLANSKIDRIVARGNVRVVRGENISYSEEAVYSAHERKITLRGRPKLVIVSTEEPDAPSGN